MEMTLSQILCYGGATGTVVCLIMTAILLKSFEKRRKKMLEKIMEDY